MAERSSRAEIGRLLRSRRERLTPQEVGLEPGPRRKTRGLRREEVAALASISTTYYAFIEQGRDVNPSRPVLDALARALQLSPAEHELLCSLALGPHIDRTAEEVAAPGLVDLVDRMDPYPTYATGRRYDILAANRGARALFADWPALPPADRNIVWFMFTEPRARTLYVDWERESAAALARFRAAAAHNATGAHFPELIERLLAASPEARELWQRHDVQPLRSGTKRLRHERLGEITLRHVVLQVADAPDQKVVTFSPADPGDTRVLSLAAEFSGS